MLSEQEVFRRRFLLFLALFVTAIFLYMIRGFLIPLVLGAVATPPRLRGAGSMGAGAVGSTPTDVGSIDGLPTASLDGAAEMVAALREIAPKAILVEFDRSLAKVTTERLHALDGAASIVTPDASVVATMPENQVR